MILSDSQILSALGANDIVINPFSEAQLGPNSYDIRLSPHLAWYKNEVLDVRYEQPIRRIKMPDDGYQLEPGKLYLGSTIEVVGSRKYVPWLDGKSSIGRLGIVVHLTAGRGDVGYLGTWCLEITTVLPVIVYPCMPIGQFSFFEAGPVRVPYDRRKSSKYGGHSPMPEPSAMWKNFHDDREPICQVHGRPKSHPDEWFCPPEAFK